MTVKEKINILAMTEVIVQYADWIGDTELRRLIDMAAVNINRVVNNAPLYDIKEQEQRVRSD